MESKLLDRAEALIHKHLTIEEWETDHPNYNMGDSNCDTCTVWQKEKGVQYKQLVNKLLDGKRVYLTQYYFRFRNGAEYSPSTVLLRDAVDAVKQKLLQRSNKKAQKRAETLRAAYTMIRARVKIVRWSTPVPNRFPNQYRYEGKKIGEWVEGVEYPELVEKLFGGEQVNVPQESQILQADGSPGMLPNRVFMIHAIHALADKLEVFAPLLRKAFKK